jgi:hypothetical protein
MNTSNVSESGACILLWRASKIVGGTLTLRKYSLIYIYIIGRTIQNFSLGPACLRFDGFRDEELPWN